MSKLATLKTKFKDRVARQKKQYKKWRATKKKGNLKAFFKHVKAVKKLKRLIGIEKKRIKDAEGTGAWGGCRSIINAEVVPIAKRYGVPITSRKRAANDPYSLSNPGSDHNEANTTADAIDLGTYDGRELAERIAYDLGIEGYTVGNFNSYYITRNGKNFRVQILWAVEGHYDHVHVGLKRV